ncbi:hypothetical protein A6V36_24305 [Paraburkholderia ginsengiterrae]|uniref:Uncharacterized protein n=1 Tax=Paraburkholderia ginsengiterrae TaxID=1462993 RepID=A0A1A9NAN0_9BURK|nr:hypothetical protein [Paraburkholderia ginsengiterrae]OAJ61498.1 hypothetical protein A6V36_24305 [Paraburkholderia ginsengiterrae]OAJ62900.1 hypothetical protein A6V37_22080 [Paraburkholderia ginsengiterrae]
MHNDAKNFAEQKAPAETEDRPRQTHDVGGLLQFLWNRMDIHETSEKELEWLSYTCDSTELMALNLRKTLIGVAALVADEMDREGLRSGAFQPIGMPELLYGAADTLSAIEEMNAIGRDANFELLERYRKLAEQTSRPLSQAPSTD